MSRNRHGRWTRGERRASIAVAALVLGAVASSVAPGAAGAGAPAPADRSSFTTTIDNPYYPLPSGQLLVYRGVRDGERQVDRVLVLDRTKVVNGVDTVVVRDVARNAAGGLIEKTFDWFAQDDHGAVWYFGENTTEFDAQGHVVSTEGSWTDGVDGARRGIIMEAAPTAPDAYRQEYYAGQAEDMAWILQTGMHVDVPYGSFDQGLRTMEWARIEPRVVDMKFYAPGIGIVLEKGVAGGQEVAKLVKVSGR
jgi:hypothetical protein